MVFRDYVQGAYRMRGIGVGQKVHVYVIPEVKELMQRELIPVKRISSLSASPSLPLLSSSSSNDDHVLEDIVAWLIINSLKSEQTQWTMLCIQNIGNLYRKNAFKALHMSTMLNAIATTSNSSMSTISSSSSSTSTESTIVTISESALDVFNESIDFSLEAGVPDPIPFEQKLREMLDNHEAFLLPEQHKIGYHIMEVVGQFSMIEGNNDCTYGMIIICLYMLISRSTKLFFLSQNLLFTQSKHLFLHSFIHSLIYSSSIYPSIYIHLLYIKS
jgi:hypothetical protein